MPSSTPRVACGGPKTKPTTTITQHPQRPALGGLERKRTRLLIIRRQTKLIRTNGAPRGEAPPAAFRTIPEVAHLGKVGRQKGTESRRRPTRQRRRGNSLRAPERSLAGSMGEPVSVAKGRRVREVVTSPRGSLLLMT